MKPIMVDLAQPRIRNRMQMTIGTTIKARLFGPPNSFLVDLPVEIHYAIISDLTQVPILQDVILYVAGERVPWERVPYRVRENWRQLMVSTWHETKGVVAKGVEKTA